MEPLVKLLTLPQQGRTLFFWILRFNGNFTKVLVFIKRLIKFLGLRILINFDQMCKFFEGTIGHNFISFSVLIIIDIFLMS